jgi:putative FmdB family regulatory protein
MPKYVYKCKECDSVIEVVHSMQEKLKDCQECGKIEALMRVPSFTLAISRNEADSTSAERVKSFIEDTRAELKEERQSLQKKEYKKDA